MPEYLGAMIFGLTLIWGALSDVVRAWDAPNLAPAAQMAASANVRASCPTNALAVLEKEIQEP